MKKLVIAATQSGAGKTTIVAGILAALKKRGLKVQAYKVGPDYIDPSFHTLASGRIAHNLDSWLVGKEKLADIFFETIGDADIAIVEGVMGLYDGGRGGISSTAEVAKILNAPVVLVIDCKSMGASAAAVALGFREFDKSINLAGVILNRLGSESHAQMIIEALDKLSIKCFGAMHRDAEIFLPERHLGLVPTAENNFASVIDKISVAVEQQINLESLLTVAKKIDSPTPLTTNHSPLTTKIAVAEKIDNPTPLTTNHSPLTTKIAVAEKIDSPTPLTTHHSPLTTKIAVAKDEAFNFYYEESLRELERLGAEIIFFSPLHDKILPEVDGLILGGGFPEMFASQLEENISMRESIKNFRKPIFAECGGYMYLMQSIKNFAGEVFEMCGVIEGRAAMTEKLQMVGYVSAVLKKNCVIGAAGDKIRAHEFHFSIEEENCAEKIFDCERLRTGKKYSAGYAAGNIVASYLHIHFKGCPSVAENFVDACKKFKGGFDNERGS